MSAFHVVVRPRPERAPSPAPAPLYGLFDVIVDGINITARITEGFTLSLLSDLSHAVATLAAGRRERAVVQLYAEDDVWELGLERDGDDALVTVFRSGAAAEVAAHERRVTLAALRTGLMTALSEAPVPPGTSEGTRGALVSARATLETSWPPAPRPRLDRAAATVATAQRGGFGFSSNALFRRSARSRGPEIRGSAVERADLHSLLVRGDLAIVARGRTATIPGAFLFLVAERLIGLAEEALEAWKDGRALFRRLSIGEYRMGIRRGPGDGPLEVSLGVGFGTPDSRSVTFPAVDASDFACSAAAFGRRLVEVFVQHDPGHERNLRLKCLATAAETLADRVEDTLADDSLTNPEPDNYRPFAPRKPAAPSSRGPWSSGGKMRFQPKWVATVPNVDLKSTHLIGERLVVGGAREIACLDRNTGGVLWRAPTSRGGSVATPIGLARIEPDGKITLLDLETGEARFCTRISPRAAGGATGAVVHSPGLPKLLVVAEGDRKITALDLVNGEVRWRYTGPRPAPYRMRRTGKLLLVTGGDSALVALDVTTGEVVWRVRDRLPFSHAVSLDPDSAFITSGNPGGRFRLHHVDPWTGEVRFSIPLDEAPVPGQAPLVTSKTVAVPVKDSGGTGIQAFARKDGSPAWEHAPGLVAPQCGWLAMEDLIVANSGAGVLVCIDSASGEIRYSHVFSGSRSADQPRRLEPVQRSGALFVPQHEIYVVRPSDGEVIGNVPSDLIPDMMRIDEQCGVYLGEESGHLAAFGAAARLALVR